MAGAPQPHPTLGSAALESGLYLTFYEEGEPVERALPAVGPFHLLVARHRLLVCERTSVHQAEELGVPIDRWLEAELELQRAMGQEPGGARRAHLRVTARDGVFVRFAVFADANERDSVPEVGPFAVVLIGRHTVEADGTVLATRKASEPAPWELASAIGTEFAGLSKPDIAFRTPLTAYHPAISPPAQRGRAPIQPAPVAAPTPPPESFTPPPTPPTAPQPAAPVPPPEQPPALTAGGLELIPHTERDRDGEARRALWRLRVLIIGVLLLGAGVYGVLLLRGGGTIP